MPRKPASRPPVDVEPRVRRAYFECRFGQLHVHNAIPAGGGGFDEATTLVCLHQSPMSGHTFEGFLRLMGRDRSVYAPDTPGCGESDAPAAPPAVADYAGAIGDFLDSMRFRQVDLLGYHTGAAIGTELAVARPQQIRRLVLVGVPLFTPAEREASLRAPAPPAPSEDGSHLLSGWRRTLAARRPGVTLEQLARHFAQQLAAGPCGAWSRAAVLRHPLRERLALVRQPVLVLRPRDELWDASLRVREVLPKARVVDLPEHGFGVFELAPQAVADAVRDFLA